MHIKNTVRLTKLIKSNFEIIHAKYIRNYFLAQIDLLIASPFLSGINNPNDIAISSVFHTITSILATTSTLSLENSILIEQDNKK